jgi:hypothetical protein
MFGEVCNGYKPWGQPGNTRSFADGIQFNENTFGTRSEHRSGAVFALADGSTKFIASKKDRPALKQQLPEQAPEPVVFDISAIDHLTHDVHPIGPRQQAYVRLFQKEQIAKKGYRDLVEGPPVSDEDVATLAEIENVAAVLLTEYNTITDAAFSSFAKMKDLRLLKFSGVSVNEHRLRQLSSSKSLKTLMVDSANITEKARKKFQSIMPSCELVIYQ